MQELNLPLAEVMLEANVLPVDKSRQNEAVWWQKASEAQVIEPKSKYLGTAVDSVRKGE